MTVRVRAALIAAMTLCAFSLAGPAGQVRAAEIPATAVPITPNLNALPVAAVPSAPGIGSIPTPDPVTAPQTATPVYASLAEAVAAQALPDTGSEALGCLAGAIYFEAKGEPLDGQLAVADVILNRSRSGHYPGDICGVVTQPGQFSFVHGGRVPDAKTDSPGYRTAMRLALVALGNAWKSSAAHALFFHAKRVGAGPRATAITAIGNHVFYR